MDQHTADCSVETVAGVEIVPEDEDDRVDGSALDTDVVEFFNVSEEFDDVDDDVIVTYDSGSRTSDGGGFIYAGAGDDEITLVGRAVDERIGPVAFIADGGRGDDVIVGSDGEDEVEGGAGNDVVHAGAGSDFILLSERVDAGDGRDRVLGGEIVRGGGGIDDLFGLEVFGGDGDDYIQGFRNHSSEMHGGPGNDFFKLQSQDDDRAPDDVHGDAGTDHVSYQFCGRCEVTLDGRANDGFVSRSGRSEGDNVRAEVLAVLSVNDNPRFDTVFGPGDDLVVGDREDNRLYTGHGPDEVDPRAGEDVVDTSHGDDVIDVRDGRIDRVECGRDRDRVVADASDRVRDDCEEVVLG